MAFRIATNVSSINTQRWLGINQTGQSKALERLSSGYKINNASDDAAGIAIATKLNVKAVSLDKSIDNGNQGIAMLQTAEGGMDQISNMLTRLKEIATQSASDNTTDRTALDQERSNLETEINNIAQSTKYGATALLSGGTTTISVGTGVGAGQGVALVDAGSANLTTTTSASLTYNATSGYATLTVGGSTQSLAVTAPTGFNSSILNFSNLGVKVTISSAFTTSITANNNITITPGAGNTFQFFMGDTNNSYNKVSVSLQNFLATGTVLNISGDISSTSNAQTYLGVIDSAISNLTTQRGNLGAAQNQISYHIANISTMSENTKAATSVIKDADFASEMANFTKSQILAQSGISMLSQTNQMNQAILSLLK